MRWAEVTTIVVLAVSAMAMAISNSFDDVVLVAVDRIPEHIYVVINGTPVPLIKVHILEFKDAVWAEGSFDPRRPVNLTVPVLSGPFLAIPKKAERVHINKGKKAVLVVGDRKIEILYSDNPEKDGLPSASATIILSGREISPDVYEVNKTVIRVLRGRWQSPPEVSVAATASSYSRYIFRIHSPPVSTRGSFSVRFTYATDFNTAAKTYSYTTQTYAYVGRGVTAINVAVRGAPASSVRLTLYYSDFPTQTLPSQTYVMTATSYAATNFGYIYTFQIPAQLRSKYLFISVDVFTGPWDVTILFEPTVTVEYERPSPFDPTWGNTVFDYVSALVEDNFYSTYLYQTRRILFIGKIPQGASVDFTSLYIGDLELYNCAGRTSQTVRIYIGGYLAGTLYMTLTSNSGLCQTFKSSATTFSAQGGFALFKFNSSLVPIVLEFDPPLTPLSGSSYYPYIKMGTLKLSGYKWAEIWLHNSSTWVYGKYMFRRGFLLFNITGDERLVNIWRNSAFTSTTNPTQNRNETNPHIMAKAELASQILHGIPVSSVEWIFRVSYTHTTYDLPGKTYLMSVCWSSPSNAPKQLYVNTAGATDYWTPVNFLTSATQLFITGIQAYNELAALLGWTTLYTNPLVGLGLTALSIILSGVQGPAYSSCSVTVNGVAYSGPGYSAGVDTNGAVRSMFLAQSVPGSLGGIRSTTVTYYIRVYYYRNNNDDSNYVIGTTFKAPVASPYDYQNLFNEAREFYAYGSTGGVIIPLAYN
ncbi:hypothetical protein ODS41_00650 [Pyrobaculum sp. 3827-6]|uniref:hypothetical protein n=1 Tax=Pyrobaculum sp. 3827-6 TaxID=2983604 RepID=UPI0021DA3D1A|nr:hypothetical protein [Pyrobaculum sp. 3827-6]MCU7786440.1 hypothetical protein [Pyrobaculum sp. 3827-6]